MSFEQIRVTAANKYRETIEIGGTCFSCSDRKGIKRALLCEEHLLPGVHLGTIDY